MELIFLDSREQTSNLKCTVHKTGNLGFTKEASEILDLDENKYVLIGYSGELNEFSELYMKAISEENPKGFKVYKAGEYYFIKMKYFFDKISIDYRNNTIIYDLIETKINDVNYLKMNKRVITKNKKGEQ